MPRGIEKLFILLHMQLITISLVHDSPSPITACSWCCVSSQWLPGGAKCQLSTLSDEVFSVAAPHIWNRRPYDAVYAVTIIFPSVTQKASLPPTIVSW